MDKQIRVPIGYAVFTPSVNTDWKIKKLLTYTRKELIYQKKKWILNEPSFKDRWGLILSAMIQASVQILYLDENHQKDICKSIIHVKFTQLKELHLWNNILSIEQLFRIQMPVIQEIYVSYNHICYIKSLRKNNYIQLKSLHLNSNFIKQLSSFGEFGNNRLHKINISWESEPPMSEESQWIAKLQSRQVSVIRMESNKKIKNIGQIELLRKSQKDIKIFDAA